MIKKLKRNFVIINMVFVAVILITIFTVVILNTHRKLKNESNNMLKLVINRPDPEPTFRLNLDNGRKNYPDSKNSLSMFHTFVVEIDDDGSVKHIFNEKNLEYSNITVINELVDDCLSNANESGIIKNGHFRYLVRTKNGVKRIAFLDRSTETNTFRFLLKTGLFLIFIALTAFFLISIYLANRIVRPIEISMNSQQQFVANASHELKTPLTVILANIDIIESHPFETISSQQKWVNYIREESRRMELLVNNLLYLARSDARKNDNISSKLNLSELLLSSYLPFESIAYEQKKHLDSRIDDNIIFQGNPKQLSELFSILIDNAIKYSDSNGTIHVELFSDSNRIYVTVQNTTKNPIETKQLKRIFERFYRIDEARSREAGGFGLGLSIAESIVRLHHGKISVTSNQREGTTFTVCFPHSF